MKVQRGPRLGQRLYATAFGLQDRFYCQQRSLIQVLAQTKNSAPTERHANTKFFPLWKSFQEKFFPFPFQARRKNSVK
jgi:hypothetical protein